MLQGQLSVYDISYLDVAICDTDLRLLLLNSLQSMNGPKVGRGDNIMTWITRCQIKLLNSKAITDTFTNILLEKMKLDVIKELELVRYFDHVTIVGIV